jgi:PAS domain-containing protein
MLSTLRRHARISDAQANLRMRSGAIRQVRMSASVVHVGEQPLILSYFRDVTAYRMAQEALRAGERELEESNAKLNRQAKLYHLTESVASVGYWAHYPGEQVVHMSAGYAFLAGFAEQRTATLAEHSDPWLQRAAKTLAAGSPGSARLTYTLLKRVKHLSLADAYRFEWVAGLMCASHGDFAEGIRALLIDKDKQPKWNPASLNEATEAWVEKFFTLPFAAEQHPLYRLGEKTHSGLVE